ncbi:MAG: hypothetical protein M1147_11190 [Nitrospirae bacterium]|nr:hypothetical protein [Nitrospirota bacterium]MCL5978654.1 hypothetical protein [Nitrospirota bacterium]
MREALAERLLARVMEWTPEDVARERPILQAMATFKYDEYQQFSPGMRFVESFALWLSQFKKKDERQIAYDFVKNRLVFCSDAEMSHFVSVAYPDYIRPLLVRHAAETLHIPERNIIKITASHEYRMLRRQCLFLGLSDGARIDIFRRNTPELSHEQIWQTYEMSTEKAKDIHDKLQIDLASLSGTASTIDTPLFRMVFLLDDFSGSGVTYLRKDETTGEFAGKISKFFEQLKRKESGLGSLVSLSDLHIGIVIYMATEKSRLRLEEMLDTLFEKDKIAWSIHMIQILGDEVTLSDTVDGSFLKLEDSYFDENANDIHSLVGGGDYKRGFGQGSLPLVLSHNTPNNSVFLLWADAEKYKTRGLFPRISRHRSTS